MASQHRKSRKQFRTPLTGPDEQLYRRRYAARPQLLPFRGAAYRGKLVGASGFLPGPSLDGDGPVQFLRFLFEDDAY